MSDKMNYPYRLILASGSPRRRKLLAKLGYAFEICISDVDEHVDCPADEAVAVLARRKAEAAAAACKEGLIIASDTLVALEGRALGKPVDEDDARRMLESLSGREHEVFTGVCLLDAATGRRMSAVERTGVRFRPLSAEEIDAYIATGEPMDKAGAYGIQGGAGKFVEALDGSFENVMGFPVDDVAELLSRFGF